MGEILHDSKLQMSAPTVECVASSPQPISRESWGYPADGPHPTSRIRHFVATVQFGNILAESKQECSQNLEGQMAGVEQSHCRPAARKDQQAQK